jgi:hypothetical protein
MVLVPFTVYADVTALALGSIYIGLSVDEPLASGFSSTPGKVIGILDIYIIGYAVPFGPTTVNVNVGPGNHYVILGIQLPGVSISAYRLQLKGAGTVIDKTFGVLEPVQYVYIAFSVDKNGAVTPISSGIIPPGGSPIANPGGGDIFGPGTMDAMMDAMTNLMIMMIPLMMFSSMMQMMMGMMAGMVSGVA